MKMNEYGLCDMVLTTKSFPELGVLAGKNGRVVSVHDNGDITVEFTDRRGRIIAFVTDNAGVFSRLMSAIDAPVELGSCTGYSDMILDSYGRNLIVGTRSEITYTRAECYV